MEPAAFSGAILRPARWPRQRRARVRLAALGLARRADEDGLARATKDIPIHGKILSKPYRPTEIASEVKVLLGA